MNVIAKLPVALGVLLSLPACERREAHGKAAAPAGGSAPSRALATPSASASLAPTASAAQPAEPEPQADEPDPTSWPEFEPAQAEADFCTDRVQVLDEDACFTLPEKVSHELLIYLHGIVPPTRTSPQKTNFERVVADASERAGVAALIPRGKQGLAPKGYPGWWGWPTTPAGYSRDGSEQVAKLRAKREKFEALLGVKFERVYLAGSSSGAYFVVGIVLNGGMPEVDGFGVMSGGSGYPTPIFESLDKRPVYVGFGKNDSVAPGARALGRMLEAAGWPVRIEAHPLSHGAREIYLDEAFAFWRKSGA